MHLLCPCSCHLGRIKSGLNSIVPSTRITPSTFLAEGSRPCEGYCTVDPPSPPQPPTHPSTQKGKKRRGKKKKSSILNLINLHSISRQNQSPSTRQASVECLAKLWGPGLDYAAPAELHHGPAVQKHTDMKTSKFHS